MDQKKDELNPPEAPGIRRRVRLRREQWIGLPILTLIPLAALLGLLGETRATENASTGQLEVAVQYPDRYRYKMLNSIRVDVTNTTPSTLDTVTIDIDTAYAARFSTVVAIPAFEHPYRIQLLDLEAEETRRVRVELQGEHYGRHEGEMRVSASAPDTARIRLSTFIFP